MLDHLPTESRETSADPTVVDVSTARLLQVGEPGGPDDVQRPHSARSHVAKATCDSRSVTAIPARPLAASPKAPALTRAARRSAMTRANSSVVFRLANSG